MRVLSYRARYSGQWGIVWSTVASQCPMLSHPIAAQIQRNQLATCLISIVLYHVSMQITHSSGALYLVNCLFHALSTCKRNSTVSFILPLNIIFGIAPSAHPCLHRCFFQVFVILWWITDIQSLILSSGSHLSHSETALYFCYTATVITLNIFRPALSYVLCFWPFFRTCNTPFAFCKFFSFPVSFPRSQLFLPIRENLRLWFKT